MSSDSDDDDILQNRFASARKAVRAMPTQRQYDDDDDSSSSSSDSDSDSGKISSLKERRLKGRKRAGSSDANASSKRAKQNEVVVVIDDNGMSSSSDDDDDISVVSNELNMQTHPTLKIAPRPLQQRTIK